MTATHSTRCIARVVDAIAENNGWTLSDDPTTPAANLTPETDAEAAEWLANGNATCDEIDCGEESDLDRNLRVGRTISAVFTPGERRAASSFDSGATSTRAQRDALRVALAGSDRSDLVADLRWYFNQARTLGEPIPACAVTAATRLLRS